MRSDLSIAILTLVLAALLSVTGRADEPEGPEGPDPVLLDFDLSDKHVVEAAAKTRTTIQEAPFIISVITTEDLRDGGYRSLSEVLRTIPGFDGDRVEFQGIANDALSRGIARSVLVMVDGVSLIEPVHHYAVLDGRIPLSTVRRIEVISGPGSVLWGSHATLGVVNVITHDGASKSGFEARAVAGGGPGAPGAAEVSGSYGARLGAGLVDVFVSGSYSTARGSRFHLEEQPVASPLLPGTPDGPWRILDESGTATGHARSHLANTTGRVRVGPVTLGWTGTFARRPLSLSPSGGALESAYFDPGATPLDLPESLTTDSRESVAVGYVRYAATLEADVDLVVQASYAWFESGLSLGMSPPSTFFPIGRTAVVDSAGSHRVSLNGDVTARLPYGNRLIGGGEFSFTRAEFATLTLPIGLLSDPSFCPSDGSLGLLGPCLGSVVVRPESERLSGGVYLTNEWRATDFVALSGGARAEFSSDAGTSALFSAGAVFEPITGLFIKAMYAEGFRPPDFESKYAADGPGPLSAPSNPNLNAARTRSVEGDVSGALVSPTSVIREWYGRLGYSYTWVEDALWRTPTGFEGRDRTIQSVEALTRFVFRGGHEVWGNYTFLDVVDPTRGRLRNVPHHILNLGGRTTFYDDKLGFAAVLTVRGEMEDLNRTASRPAEGSLGYGPGPGVDVAVTGLEVTDIGAVALLRLGVDSRRLFGHLDVALWVDNVLDQTWVDPDLDFEARVQGRPLPRPGISFRFEARVNW